MNKSKQKLKVQKKLPKKADIELMEKEIQKIKDRNRSVEMSKAWETSVARKVLIAILTFVVIAIVYYFAGVKNPLSNALVPSAAFLLSTLSLPFAKKLWLKKYKN